MATVVDVTDTSRAVYYYVANTACDADDDDIRIMWRHDTVVIIHAPASNRMPWFTFLWPHGRSPYRALRATDLYKYSPDAVSPIHAVSYHVAADKPPPKMATISGLFLATIYNQSQLAERKHVARYWSINTAATTVPLSSHPSPLVITTKLTAAILGGPLFGGGVLPAQYCPCAPSARTSPLLSTF